MGRKEENGGKLPAMVDRLGDLNIKLAAIAEQQEALMAPVSKEKDALESKIRDFCRERDIAEFTTGTYALSIKPRKTTEIQPDKLFKLVKELGKSNLFFELVKVRITEARKMIGEIHLSKIWDVTVEEWKTVTVKLRKSK
jgi:hypothetical protein